MTLFKTTCESDFKALIFTLTCAEFFLEVYMKLCFEVPLLLKIAISSNNHVLAKLYPKHGPDVVTI